MSSTKAIIQWTCDCSFSIISSSSIKSGILDVGETVEAYYGKKIYSGTVLEKGKQNEIIFS